MKKILFLTVLCIFSLSTMLLSGEKKYGKAITVEKSTAISEILEHPEKYNGKQVKVEGAITDVCEKQGCWISIAGDKDEQTLRFKVKDGVIVFPVDAKGKNVSAQGVVSVKTMTKEELIAQGKEHAEEEGKTFDPSTITGPKIVIQLQGEGAVIK